MRYFRRGKYKIPVNLFKTNTCFYAEVAPIDNRIGICKPVGLRLKYGRPSLNRGASLERSAPLFLILCVFCTIFPASIVYRAASWFFDPRYTVYGCPCAGVSFANAVKTEREREQFEVRWRRWFYAPLIYYWFFWTLHMNIRAIRSKRTQHGLAFRYVGSLV